MWRSTLVILRKIILPTIRDNTQANKLFHSIKRQPPPSPMKISLIGASVGIAIGAGYGGYTHYIVNSKKTFLPVEHDEYAIFKELPEYTPHYKIVNDSDKSNLKLIIFQYRTCPFCCKVRAYLDARGISYEVVEVDAVLRQAIKWSPYKKVPIVLAQVEGGYQQLMDSTAIISVLETYLRDQSLQLQDVVKFYPPNSYMSNDGKKATDITNKYFIMHNSTVIDEKEKNAEIEEREWRQWADQVLVHTLSPNVYRTASEALETFKWFEDVGGWRQNFPSWECALMVYGGAAAMWIISKRLKARHNIEDARQALYDAANKWMSAVTKKGTPFLGGAEPNLADISVYGVLSSIEGCRAFQDLRKHSSLGKWYDEVKNTLENQRGKVQEVAAYA